MRRTYLSLILQAPMKRRTAKKWMLEIELFMMKRSLLGRYAVTAHYVTEFCLWYARRHEYDLRSRLPSHMIGTKQHLILNLSPSLLPNWSGRKLLRPIYKNPLQMCPSELDRWGRVKDDIRFLIPLQLIPEWEKQRKRRRVPLWVLLFYPLTHIHRHLLRRSSNLLSNPFLRLNWFSAPLTTKRVIPKSTKIISRQRKKNERRLALLRRQMWQGLYFVGLAK